VWGVARSLGKLYPLIMRKETYPQLGALLERVTALEADFRGLQHEWVETHRKLLNTLRSIQRGGGKKAPEAEPNAHEAVPAPVDAVTAAILARRSKGKARWDTQQTAKNSG